MVFGVPRASRLMKAAQPQDGIGGEFVTHLEPLEVVLLRGDEVFAEDAKLLLCESKYHVRIEPSVIVAPMRLAGSRERLGGYEHFKFAGGMLMLRRRGPAGERSQQNHQSEGAPRSWHSEDFSLAHAFFGDYLVWSTTITGLSKKCESIGSPRDLVG